MAARRAHRRIADLSRHQRLFFIALLGILVFLTFAVAACGDNDGGGGGEAASVEISANNITFDRDEITVPAGSRVELEFTNEEAVPHNVSVYRSEAATDAIFQGELITGPDETVTYEFDAPDDPGTYFFRCDVHPDQMTGDFVVE